MRREFSVEWRHCLLLVCAANRVRTRAGGMLKHIQRKPCRRHCEFHTGRSSRPFWMKARTGVIASAAKQSKARMRGFWIASLRSQ
jgi:hypothetical protein